MPNTIIIINIIFQLETFDPHSILPAEGSQSHRKNTAKEVNRNGKILLQLLATIDPYIKIHDYYTASYILMRFKPTLNHV